MTQKSTASRLRQCKNKNPTAELKKYISGQTVFKKEKLESFVVIDSEAAGKINTR